MTAGSRAYVLLADSVMVTDGRLHVQGGGWNHLYPQEIPTAVGRIGIGLLLHLPVERGPETAEVTLRMDDPRGEPVALFAGQQARPLHGVAATVRLSPPPDGSPLDEYLIPMAINLDGVALETVGTYRVVVSVDGAEAGEAAFAVMVAQP